MADRALMPFKTIADFRGANERRHAMSAASSCVLSRRLELFGPRRDVAIRCSKPSNVAVNPGPLVTSSHDASGAGAHLTESIPASRRLDSADRQGTRDR